MRNPVILMGREVEEAMRAVNLLNFNLCGELGKWEDRKQLPPPALLERLEIVTALDKKLTAAFDQAD